MVPVIAYPCAIGRRLFVKPHRLDFQHTIDGKHLFHRPTQTHRRQLRGMRRHAKLEQSFHQAFHMPQLLDDVLPEMAAVFRHAPQVAQFGLRHVLLDGSHFVGQCPREIPM